MIGIRLGDVLRHGMSHSFDEKSPMLGWLVILAAVIVMARVAEAEDRSPVLWGALTFLLCVGAGTLIPPPLVNIFLGLAASFLLMLAMNVATGS